MYGAEKGSNLQETVEVIKTNADVKAVSHCHLGYISLRGLKERLVLYSQLILAMCQGHNFHFTKHEASSCSYIILLSIGDLHCIVH